MRVFAILAMLFLHVIDDFVLQAAFLTNGKQRSWWEKNTDDPMYKWDYIPCLIAHSVSWTFIVMLPIFWYRTWDASEMVGVFILNATIHGITDDLKANQKKINLIVDQSIHVAQIIITGILFLFIFV